MRRFSERLGIIKPREALQIKSMDDRLRNRLGSCADKTFWQSCASSRGFDYTADIIIEHIQDSFFGEPVSGLSWDHRQNIIAFLVKLQGFGWNEYYDFCQFLADFSKIYVGGQDTSGIRYLAENYIILCNNVLEEEKSGYRFVGGELCPIVSDLEVAALEAAVNVSDKYRAARIHVETAIKMYSDRKAPDYRNSIKEAISAVEAFFSVFNAEKSKNMQGALASARKKGLNLPRALENGISNIYGWTSDEAGVRHALFEDKGKVSEPDARFALITCAALINYLVQTS
nr:hypothetical protein [Rhodobacter capsulatus]